jgi:hypothetical protein
MDAKTLPCALGSGKEAKRLTTVRRPLRETLPSNLGKETVGPCTDAVLPRLIKEEESQAKCSWQKPVLDRHFASANGIL